MASTAGYKSVFKDGEFKKIPKSELDNYLNDGWILKGKPHSDEHKKRISESIAKQAHIHKGNEGKRVPKEEVDYWLSLGWELGDRPMSEEGKRHVSEGLRGKPLSEIHKAHLRKPHGPVSEEECYRRSIRMIGNSNAKGPHHTPRSPEHCKKISEYRKGTKNSPEARRKMSEALKKAYKEGRMFVPHTNKYKTSYYRDKYLRSSYEAVYTAYCKFKKWNFEFADRMVLTSYEDDGKIKYNYHPDFYLPDTNTIVETNRGINKELLKLREEVTLQYGYNWELVLYDKIDEYYYEMLNAGININELWDKLYSCKPGSVHWDYVDDKIIFIESEEKVNE